jgi:hypothetical protein
MIPSISIYSIWIFHAKIATYFIKHLDMLFTY